MTIAICFGQFGPYHHARVAALQAAAHEQGARVVPVQISSDTATYEWKEDDESRVKSKMCEPTGGRQPEAEPRATLGSVGGAAMPPKAEDLQTLCHGVEEEVSPLDVFLKARRLFRGEKVDVAFLPSYSPARYFALFAAAKSLGIRTVMMNESHAGTEQATGWKRWIKRQIVKRFDAAFVGGEPHKRHFASLGIPAEKIFTGYDAVDGDFFAQHADEIRAGAKKSVQFSVSVGLEQACLEDSAGSSQTGQQSLRDEYGLPERYFLSLGRMVEKKNLATLVAAYARYCDESRGFARQSLGNRVTSDESARQAPASLVFVGSGELEGALREQVRALGLRVVDRTQWGANKDKTKRLRDEETRGLERQAEPLNSKPSTLNEENCGSVFFYGFRQIEENAVFYALAEAFVLPSLKEEWGLVVNEAMAAGLPVIASRTAGCAEDLLPEATASRSMEQEADARAARPYLELRSNGFAFDPRSVDALSEALRRIADCGTADGGAESAGRPLGKPAATLKAVMGKRSREIVAGFSCENFARQAMRAAEATRH